MKTPREILLARHQSAEPDLDRLTREVLRDLPRPPRKEQQRTLRWADWLWPSPAAWGAVAAVWLVILGFNVASFEPPAARPALARHTPETLRALREQRQLFAELVAPPGREPEPVRPRRRSDCLQSTSMA